MYVRLLIHVMDARCPQLFRSTSVIPADAELPTETIPATLKAGKDLICVASAKAFGNPRVVMSKPERVRNAGAVVARKPGVKLADKSRG